MSKRTVLLFFVMPIVNQKKKLFHFNAVLSGEQTYLASADTYVIKILWCNWETVKTKKYICFVFKLFYDSSKIMFPLNLSHIKVEKTTVKTVKK